MKKMILSMLVTVVGSSSVPAFAADDSLAFNAAVTSDYRYRGISQTRLDPAIQAGADYTRSDSGVYAGAWASSIKWIEDAGGDSNVELDLYAGKRGNVGESLSYDVGVLTYVYPNNQLGDVAGFENANTTEIYGQLGYGVAYLRYSHALTNLFGFVDSKNSGYLDAGANISLTEKLTLNLHIGHQEVENNSAVSYDDWKVGLTRDFGICTLSVAGIGTNADKSAYTSPANGKFLGKNALVATLSKVF